MPGINYEKDFSPLKIAILTISDSRTEETDRSGKLLAQKIKEAGHHLAEKKIVRDEPEEIKNQVANWIKNREIDVIITTGGTGITGRDVTPDTLAELWDKELPGFGEYFRQISLKKIGLAALLSRACAGVAGSTYIFALPGSTNACRDAWEEILIYLLDNRYQPCNFSELLPRLKEK